MNKQRISELRSLANQRQPISWVFLDEAVEALEVLHAENTMMFTVIQNRNNEVTALALEISKLHAALKLMLGDPNTREKQEIAFYRNIAQEIIEEHSALLRKLKDGGSNET